MVIPFFCTAAGWPLRRGEPARTACLITDGKIAAVGTGLKAPPGAATLDCSGRILLPGMFDMHVHMREPGREDRETIASSTEAAINGGITGLLAMPNTQPSIDSGGLVRFVRNIARERARIPVQVAGCATMGREGKQIAEVADMLANGAVMITDDDHPIENPNVLRRLMEYARPFDVVIATHPDTPALTGKGAMNEGRASFDRGLPGIPSCGEEIAIGRDLRLAKYTGARVHIQQVSTASGLEIIRRFREEGLRVTAEITPHHLIFCDEDVGEYDTLLKTNPPLRTREDRALLLQGLRDGLFDVIATGHAPHTEFDKNQDFLNAPAGITGLDTALLSLHHHGILAGHFGWDVIVRCFSENPRRILGLPLSEIRAGCPADLLVFNPAAATAVTRDFLQSRSHNTPFLGKTLTGSVDWVMADGRLVLDRGTRGAA
ncbi:MAG: dihydroorotase [Kiritimatiellia bacterium]